MHKLTPSLSLDIVTGIQARVKAWVEEFIAKAQWRNKLGGGTGFVPLPLHPNT
jgi:hypothetical protein